MKRIFQQMTLVPFLVLFFAFIAKPVSAQQTGEVIEIKGETYQITDNGSAKDVQPYIDALAGADMRYHRLRNKNFTIVFMSGLKVELFSASQIKSKGKTIDLNGYPEEFDSSRQEPVFAIGANNYIIEYHTAVPTKINTVKKQ